MAESGPTQPAEVCGAQTVFWPDDAVEDACRLCGGWIWWAEGGRFWLHVDNPDADHVAQPATRTDLKPFTGCTLHRDTPQPDVCDTCNNT